MNHYFELRNSPHFPATHIGADIARHLEVRQYLGAAVIVCESPFAMISVLRKQWMHLARAIQKERSSTLNAEDILRLTHTIMHMHHMQFTPKVPQEMPDAHVYFVTPEQLSVVPPNCFTLYLTCPVAADKLRIVAAEMADAGLVVSYDPNIQLNDAGLRPKSELETEVTKEWAVLNQFLHRHHIRPPQLVSSSPTHLEATDEALDTLLGVSNEFLRIATAVSYSGGRAAKTICSCCAASPPRAGPQPKCV
jgi:hypothetical protein